MNRAAVVLAIALALPVVAAPNTRAAGDGDRVLAGRVVRIEANHFRFDEAATRAEKRYPVQVFLDPQPPMILGFPVDAAGGLRPADHVLYELLLKALEHDWPVKIRWESEVVFSKPFPSSARIVSVSVQPDPPGRPARR